MAACALQAHSLRIEAAASTASQCTRPGSTGQPHMCGAPSSSKNESRSRVVGSSMFSFRRLANSYGGGKEFLGRTLHLEVALKEASTGQHHRQLPHLKVEAAKRVHSGRSFALSSTLAVLDGKEQEATALCKRIIQWGDKKKKEKGSGLQVFECNADPFEKNVYHFWEIYDSFAFMNDLRSSAEHSKFMADVRPLLVGPIGLAAYEYRDGQIGHMMNPIGPKGEGGLDDATGQSGTKQQSSSIGQGLGEYEEDVDSKAWGLEKMLAKVRGEDKEGGWDLKTLLGGSAEKKANS